MKKTAFFAVLTLAFASQAMALDLVTIGGLTTAGIVVGGNAGAVLIGLGVGTSVAAVTTGLANAKEAELVVNAVPDAVAVLNGGQATDAFAEGRRAIETAAGVQFESDYDAALGIVQVAQAL